MPRNLSPSDVNKFRDRLCDVATVLLSEVGRDGFNMRELAGRLGVSAMTTYRYFQDKDEILAAVRARAFARFADRMEGAAACPGTASQKIAALVRTYAEFAREEQIHYRLMFDLSEATNAVPAEFRAEELRARAALTRQLCQVADEGAFDGDPDLAGSVLWSALHGITALHLTGTFRDAEFERVLSETMHVFARTYMRGAEIPTRPAMAVDASAIARAYDGANGISLSPAE
jgi:AcrR family transcriptional regulator